jgi:hypothetical protein
LFKVVQNPPKQVSPEHKQLCDALKPTKKDNAAKIQTFSGMAVWLQPQNLKALSLLCTLRNILEHGHAGTNATASAKTAGGALAQQWQLLKELGSASLAFLQAIGFEDPAFPMHAYFQEDFLAAHKTADYLLDLFTSAGLAPPLWLRFTLPASSRAHGLRKPNTLAHL